MKLPKHMDPKEYVIARRKELVTALDMNEFASDGVNHQVPTVPATVTVEIF